MRRLLLELILASSTTVTPLIAEAITIPVAAISASFRPTVRRRNDDIFGLSTITDSVEPGIARAIP
jgi:hypothetical protein